MEVYQIHSTREAFAALRCGGGLRGGENGFVSFRAVLGLRNVGEACRNVGVGVFGVSGCRVWGFVRGLGVPTPKH